MTLQLAGVALLVWSGAETDHEPIPQFARQILVISLLGLAIVVLQLVPLPYHLWSQIGPRHGIAAGYRLLGLSITVEPVSLTPSAGLNSVFGTIPPLAIFCSIVKLKAYRLKLIAVAILAATLAGILIGALQVSSVSRISRWYFYHQTNYGSAVGFFANGNHMAILIVASLPFLAAMISARETAEQEQSFINLMLAVGCGLVLFVGLAINGSLAGYGLGLSVLAASILIVFRMTGRVRLGVFAAVALLAISSVVALELHPLDAQLFAGEATTSIASRQEIFSTTLKGTRDFFPFGSGLGSFQSVYHLYEDPNHVGTSYINHAHNDYLELALETGFVGILLIAAFLVCWAAAVWRVFKPAGGGPFARAAAIASAAILVHSLVDFPLRTAGISSLFAVCLALLADPSVSTRRDPKDLRVTRHLAIR